jgi:LAO/AO transport system kinase
VTAGAELGARLRKRDLSAAPAVLNLVESRGTHEEVAALLREVSPAALGDEAPAHVVGVTGPPGAGKSTLLGELVRAWRSDGRSVAVLAVDPSSRRSGGALLGDRARIPFDPADEAVFIRRHTRWRRRSTSSSSRPSAWVRARPRSPRWPTASP